MVVFNNFFYNGYEFVEPTLHTLQILNLNDSYQYLKNAQEIYPHEIEIGRAHV